MLKVFSLYPCCFLIYILGLFLFFDLVHLQITCHARGMKCQVLLFLFYTLCASNKVCRIFGLQLVGALNVQVSLILEAVGINAEKCMSGRSMSDLEEQLDGCFRVCGISPFISHGLPLDSRVDVKIDQLNMQLGL